MTLKKSKHHRRNIACNISFLLFSLSGTSEFFDPCTQYADDNSLDSRIFLRTFSSFLSIQGVSLRYNKWVSKSGNSRISPLTLDKYRSRRRKNSYSWKYDSFPWTLYQSYFRWTSFYGTLSNSLIDFYFSFCIFIIFLIEWVSDFIRFYHHLYSSFCSRRSVSFCLQSVSLMGYSRENPKL